MMKAERKEPFRMSVRLHMVADMITPGLVVADIGTDHGYIPIYQVLTGRSPYAYACDVKEGPLKRAEEHVRQYQAGDRVKTVLSDGLLAFAGQEVRDGDSVSVPESVVIAGMGGKLMCDILKAGQSVAENAKELILSPHSEIEEVRKYLYQHGLNIVDENMIKEDGKYYAAMRAVRRKDGKNRVPEELELRFGPCLLKKKHPVLMEFLHKEIDTCQRILANLEENGRQDVPQRISRISLRMERAREAQRICMED